MLVTADGAEATRAALVAAGAHPVSEAAAEILRVEHGRPRYGFDLADATIPQEAGLNERAVSFTKGCYVGQETVARLFYRGKPNRHLRGLRLSEPRRPARRSASASRRSACSARASFSPPRADRARARPPRGRSRRHASRWARPRPRWWNSRSTHPRPRPDRYFLSSRRRLLTPLLTFSRFLALSVARTNAM